MAIIEIDILDVEESRRDAVFHELVQHQGPQDGTVIVCPTDGAPFHEEMETQLLETFCEAGDIILVRFQDNSMVLTFRQGSEALRALQYDQTEICGRVISVVLQTQDWREQIEREMSLVKSNTAALFNATTHSLLGEDFSMGTYDDGKTCEIIHCLKYHYQARMCTNWVTVFRSFFNMCMSHVTAGRVRLDFLPVLHFFIFDGGLQLL